MTGGGGRKGAKGAVSGGGTLIMGARGRCARGGDVGPPWFAMWPGSLAAEPGSTLVRHRRQCGCVLFGLTLRIFDDITVADVELAVVVVVVKNILSLS